MTIHRDDDDDDVVESMRLRDISLKRLLCVPSTNWAVGKFEQSCTTLDSQYADCEQKSNVFCKIILHSSTSVVCGGQPGQPPALQFFPLHEMSWQKQHLHVRARDGGAGDVRKGHFLATPSRKRELIAAALSYEESPKKNFPMGTFATGSPFESLSRFAN
ncbi:hypothetical protein ANO14919_056670 [Xylariales sp. No.14919]|nr:hypothetical protein ANO14919_056670 [Xylariales sp. No.14919]